ncbi:MAG: lysozyme inhibitor LprI family protein [bacterium]|nr:lysozyme inhibitor LprI family protein [bacterium]
MQRIIAITLCLVVMSALCASAQSQHEMNSAAAAEYKLADAELNKVYRKLRAKLDGDERRKLIATQQAWIKFRDADCEFAALPSRGGTIYPLVHFGALTEKATARTEELRWCIEDYGGR